ncbi:hypothetical protein S83_035709, partial [Arachis hypogaea]
KKRNFFWNRMNHMLQESQFTRGVRERLLRLGIADHCWLFASALNVDSHDPKAIHLRQMNLGRLGSLDALKIGKV